MTTVKEVNKVIERMEKLRSNCKRLEMFAINSDPVYITDFQDKANLGIPLHMMCDEIQAVLESEILRMQNAVENAKVDVKPAFFA